MPKHWERLGGRLEIIFRCKWLWEGRCAPGSTVGETCLRAGPWFSHRVCWLDLAAHSGSDSLCSAQWVAEGGASSYIERNSGGSKRTLDV